MDGGQVVATTPELWNVLVSICNHFGIDVSQLPSVVTTSQIVEFCQQLNVKLVPLYRTVQSGWTWVVNEAPNPAESRDMVVRGLTDIAVADGAATSITQGKRVFGSVSKRIAAGAIIAAIGISTFAAQIQEHITRLTETLTPWTTDGEHVPVMVDENGNTYIDERAINAFRQGLIDLGVFRGGSAPTGLEYYFWSTHYFTNDFQSELGDFSTDLNEGLRYYTYGINNQQGRVEFISYAGQPVKNFCFGFTSWDGAVRTAHGAYIIEPATTGEFIRRVYQSNGSYSDSGNGSSSLTVNVIRNGVTYTYNVKYKATIGSGTINTTNPTANSYWQLPDGMVFNTLPTQQTDHISSSQMADYVVTNLVIKDLYGEAGVDGYVVSNRSVGDIQNSLTDIFPEWAQNAIKYPTPTDENLGNQTDFFPVSITDTEPFAHDITSSATDQDGDTTEDTQQEIINQLKELLETLSQRNSDGTTNPEIVTPTVPVGDSGDTPPATPALISGASNGLWTIYNPTLSEVQQFGAWLWSENIIDQIIRQFNNPIEAVIGFLSLYATPITGDRKVIKAGYLSSPVSAKEVTNQYITLDCGSVDVPEYYKTAIDYTRTKVDIYLPFIGIMPLDCSVVMGSVLHVIYRIDVLTGTCIAQIKVIKRNSDAVMYVYNGNCGVQLPLTASTYTGTVGTLIGLANLIIGATTGNAEQAVSGGINAMSSAVNNLTGTAKSGVLSSNAGALGIRIPYLIITHPTAYDAMIYNQMYGYPSNEYQRLSALSGFVRVKSVHLRDITCTDQELQMIYDKLKKGIIIS